MNFNDFSGSIKHAAKERAITYAKSYNLLHRQLVQKKRAGIYKTATIYIENKAYFILGAYNIKSPSREPYKPYSKDEPNDFHLGLNQLFVGQSPFKQYNGDPKKGIYHDECMIFPKTLKTINFKAYNALKKEQKNSFFPYTDNFAYVLSDNEITLLGNSFKNTETKLYFYKRDAFGQEYIKNVEFIEQKNSFKDGKNMVKNKLKITYADKVEFIEITPPCIGFDGSEITQGVSLIEYENVSEKKLAPPILDLEHIKARYGDITHMSKIFDETASIPNIYQIPTGAISLAKARELIVPKSQEPKDYGVVQSVYMVFQKGYALKVRAGFKYNGAYFPPQVAHLTLVDEQGELLLSKFEFIDNWDNFWYLHVKEHKKWYHKVIAPLVVILSVVVAVILPMAGYAALGLASSSVVSIAGISVSVGTIAALSGAFAGLGALGMLKGDKTLKLIGTIGGLITSIAITFSQHAIKTASLKSVSKEALSKTTTKTFSWSKALSFANSPWLKSLAAAANAVYSTMNAFKEKQQPKEQIKEKKETVKVDNEELIVQPNFIQKIIDITTLQGRIQDEFRRTGQMVYRR